MSTTVNIVVIVVPPSSVAVTLYIPGVFWVGTLTMAVKLPFASVVSGYGTVVICVPFQVIVISELWWNPEPVMVVAANPESGVNVSTSGGANAVYVAFSTLWGIETDQILLFHGLNDRSG